MPQINSSTQSNRPFFINQGQQEKLFAGLNSGTATPPRTLNIIERAAVATANAVDSVGRLFGLNK